ncbi:unnamed protein product [Trypanosoma congolense IL3000]|uniref:WGS project CAEQ00000000 data, annotated contig 2370 n=1 Tax=Trypanosoma congolense (strain IL3000) TaxID=1068625 RepID=F9WDJ1_TRYCI|nr:unnamed protein product [Trypanosoma congolense IL3000]
MKWTFTCPAEVEVELAVVELVRASLEPLETARGFFRSLLHGARQYDAQDGQTLTTDTLQKAMRQVVFEDEGGGDLQTLAMRRWTTTLRYALDPETAMHEFLLAFLGELHTLDRQVGNHRGADAFYKAAGRIVFGEARPSERDLQTLAIQYVARSVLQSEDPERKARELLGGVLHEARQLDREHHHHQGEEALLKAMEEILPKTAKG